MTMEEIGEIHNVFSFSPLFRIFLDARDANTIFSRHTVLLLTLWSRTFQLQQCVIARIMALFRLFLLRQRQAERIKKSPVRRLSSYKRWWSNLLPLMTTEKSGTWPNYALRDFRKEEKIINPEIEKSCIKFRWTQFSLSQNSTLSQKRVTSKEYAYVHKKKEFWQTHKVFCFCFFFTNHGNEEGNSRKQSETLEHQWHDQIHLREQSHPHISSRKEEPENVHNSFGGHWTLTLWVRIISKKIIASQKKLKLS